MIFFLVGLYLGVGFGFSVFIWSEERPPVKPGWIWKIPAIALFWPGLFLVGMVK